jgi:hypothetical protein
MLKTFKFILLITIITFTIGFDALGQGCSQCRMLSEQGSELSANSFGSSINSGILYLMAMPYFILMFLFRKQIKALFLRLRSKITRV